MIREDYKLNARTQRPAVPAAGRDARRGAHARRRPPLPAGLLIDWQHFFRVGEASPQRSKLIDLSL